jgi:N-acetylglucosamine-6-phosphate deacetylase
LKIKGIKTILVSDSTMYSGMQPGEYATHIGNAVKLEKSGRLSTVANSKILAGSAVSILDCIKKLTSDDLATLSHSWSCASVNPAHLLGIENLDVLNPALTDFVIFRYADGNIEIKYVFKNKEMVFTN